ncbi:MAG: urease accessory UreF family protein, partial [Pseudomonadota bacterium]
AEATALGTAFRDAYLAAWRPSAGSAFDALGRAPVALAVAVGVAAREHALALRATLDAFAAAQLSNQISAAIRLGVVGQIAGQRISAALLEPAAEACALAETAGEDDLGGASWGADLASMLHEEQQPRLFRS